MGSGRGAAGAEHPVPLEMCIQGDIQLRGLELRHRRVLRCLSGPDQTLRDDLLQSAVRSGLRRQARDRFLG